MLGFFFFFLFEAVVYFMEQFAHFRPAHNFGGVFDKGKIQLSSFFVLRFRKQVVRPTPLRVASIGCELSVAGKEFN
jgi:hypothetical protein